MRHSGLILVVLGLLAAVSLGGAYQVLVASAPTEAAPPARLFAALDDAALARVAQVRITYGLGLAGVQPLTLTRTPEGGFTIAEYGDYPADAGELARLLAALQRLEPLARKTARPEWHRRLGLVAPQELGQAIQIDVRDEMGRELAGLLIGKPQESEGARALEGARAETLAQERFYVRRLNEAQSFLVRTAWRVPREPEQWLSQTLPWLRADEVRQLRVRNLEGGRRIFARTAPDLPFAGASGALPAGDVETLFAALRRLGVMRVARAETMAARTRTAPKATLQLESFDGEQLTLEITPLSPLSQLRFSASGSARAQTWQARYNPWVYLFQEAALAPFLLDAP